MLRVASTQIEQLFSYDAATIRADVSEAQAIAGGDFAEEFTRLLSGRARRVITALDAVSTAQVIEVGTIDERRDQTVLLAFLRQTTTSRTHPAPRLDVSAVEVTLGRTGDTWQIQAVKRMTPQRNTPEEGRDGTDD